MFAMTDVLPRTLPVPAAAGRLVSRASVHRMLRDQHHAVRLRTISALGPNAAAHRGRASVHEDAIAVIETDAPLTMQRCRELAEHFLGQAQFLREMLASLPDGVRTPEEIFDAARADELIAAALRFSAGTAGDHAKPMSEYTARVRLILDEGTTDPEAIFAEAWDEGVWG